MAELTVYGAPWCPHCRRTKQFLEAQRIDFVYVDIDREPTAVAKIEELQNGGRTIPTIVLPDGAFVVAPSNGDLAQRLGVRLVAARILYDVAIIGASRLAAVSSCARTRCS